MTQSHGTHDLNASGQNDAVSRERAKEQDMGASDDVAILKAWKKLIAEHVGPSGQIGLRQGAIFKAGWEAARRAAKPAPEWQGMEPQWVAVNSVSGAHIGMWKDERIARRVFNDEYPDGEFIPLYAHPAQSIEPVAVKALETSTHFMEPGEFGDGATVGIEVYDALPCPICHGPASGGRHCDTGDFCVGCDGDGCGVAVPGLTSYRCRGRFGWIMIGARDVADALHEAARSERDAAKRENLQVWNGRQYVPVAT